MSAFARMAESKIRAAIANGEFDDLPGRGKPLARDDLARVPAELRAAYRILRNAGHLPPELEARKEAARLGALIDATSDPEERARLSGLRRDAELRYALLTERSRRRRRQFPRLQPRSTLRRNGSLVTKAFFG